MTADERRLETAILILRGEFDKAKNNRTVKKPVSYALYKAWRYADAREKERDDEKKL